MRRSIAMLAFAGTAGLAICTAALAQAGGSAAQAPHEAAALTAADADAFVARAERELAEFSLINNRAQWVNATYITDDTNALAAYFGTIDTEMRVRLDGEAARYANVSGLSADTRRKLGLLRNGLVLAAPTTAGAAAELNRISTDLASQYGRGHATMNGETIGNSKPLIKANLATLGEIDPGSVEMRISGFGPVAVKYDPATKTAQYQVTQKLREPEYTVIITAKSKGKRIETKWDFKYDSTAALSGSGPSTDASALPPQATPAAPIPAAPAKAAPAPKKRR